MKEDVLASTQAIPATAILVFTKTWAMLQTRFHPSEEDAFAKRKLLQLQSILSPKVALLEAQWVLSIKNNYLPMGNDIH